MSLLSAILLPALEKHLGPLKPQIAQLVVDEIAILGEEVMAYIEKKFKLNEECPQDVLSKDPHHG